MGGTEALLKEALSERIPAGYGVGPNEPPEEMPEIKAETVRELLVRRDWADRGPSPRLHLRHVRIVGELNLDECRLGARLLLQRCELTDKVYLQQAVSRDIRILGCRLAGGIEASQLSVDWNL